MATKTTPGKKPDAPVKPVVTRSDSREGTADTEPEPHLPHEADQSASNQHSDAPQNAELGRQAKADVDRGLVDTGPTPVMDKLYKEQFAPPHETTPRRKPGV